MSLKFFTDAETQKSIAINSIHVVYVEETSSGAKIIFPDGSYFFVTDSYLDAVARLNS